MRSTRCYLTYISYYHYTINYIWLSYIVTQVEVPSGSDPWSDRARRKLPLIRPSQTKVSSDQTNVRSKHRVRSKCARNCLWSDLPRGKDLWSDHNQTIVQTIVRPWPSSNPDHCPDDCALKITSDQPIVRSKVTPDQTIVRSKSPHSTNFVIIYSFHTKWCLHYYIHLKKDHSKSIIAKEKITQLLCKKLFSIH